jgi:tripartite-type tricarboxylate transporter receptor subunit TctC
MKQHKNRQGTDVGKPSMWIRHLGTLALAAVALAVTSAADRALAADAFGGRPVRIVVGFGPGGLGDVVARTVAQHMSESTGANFFIENMPGAGGITAATSVAHAAPDGHTLLLVSGQNAFSSYLFKSLPYDPVKDFTMLSTIGTFHFLVVTAQDSPLKNMTDLAASAKKDPRAFNFGTISVGSAQHLSALLLMTMAKLDVTMVPYKSTGEVITALRGHDVQAGLETVTGALAQVQQGALRALATTSAKRLPFLPNVPTVAESGVPGLAEYESDSWNGFVAPAGTPREMVAALNAEINQAVAAPAVQKRLAELGVEPRAGTPEAMRQTFARDAAKWRAVIEQAKIEKQ